MPLGANTRAEKFTCALLEKQTTKIVANIKMCFLMTVYLLKEIECLLNIRFSCIYSFCKDTSFLFIQQNFEFFIFIQKSHTIHLVNHSLPINLSPPPYKSFQPKHKKIFSPTAILYPKPWDKYFKPWDKYPKAWDEYPKAWDIIL